MTKQKSIVAKITKKMEKKEYYLLMNINLNTND